MEVDQLDFESTLSLKVYVGIMAALASEFHGSAGNPGATFSLYKLDGKCTGIKFQSARHAGISRLG